MPEAALPAAVLLYITGATYVTNVVVNGVRTAVVIHPLTAFLGACGLGWVFVLLFMLANSVELTPALWAGSVIAGVLVGGASAGSNAVHSRTLPSGSLTDAIPSASGEGRPGAVPPAAPPSVAEIAAAVTLSLEQAREARVKAGLAGFMDRKAPEPVPSPEVAR